MLKSDNIFDNSIKMSLLIERNHRFFISPRIEFDRRKKVYAILSTVTWTQENTIWIKIHNVVN